eukprot:TRINITY_DN773203_c0_g1_i1.p1 TRINITY_DN773203_c0_g1~~TRINITY_DN773203_c0_g1_i1.p1  ORF type:complete len:498 (-),score=148.28 TRINITY_DN773203_c0_g1_i1:306-1682(-)
MSICPSLTRFFTTLSSLVSSCISNEIYHMQQCNTLRTQLSEASVELVDLSAKLPQALKDLAEEQRQVERVNTECTTLNNMIEDLRREIDELKSSENELYTELNATQQDLSSEQIKTQSLSDDIEEFKEAQTGLEGRLAAIEEENCGLQAEVQAFKQLNIYDISFKQQLSKIKKKGMQSPKKEGTTTNIPGYQNPISPTTPHFRNSRNISSNDITHDDFTYSPSPSISPRSKTTGNITTTRSSMSAISPSGKPPKSPSGRRRKSLESSFLTQLHNNQHDERFETNRSPETITRQYSSPTLRHHGSSNSLSSISSANSKGSIRRSNSQPYASPTFRVDGGSFFRSTSPHSHSPESTDSDSIPPMLLSKAQTFSSSQSSTLAQYISGQNHQRSSPLRKQTSPSHSQTSSTRRNQTYNRHHSDQHDTLLDLESSSRNGGKSRLPVGNKEMNRLLRLQSNHQN